MTRYLHKLRIAWSVGWGIACVLLIALWSAVIKMGQASGVYAGATVLLHQINRWNSIYPEDGYTWIRLLTKARVTLHRTKTPMRAKPLDVVPTKYGVECWLIEIAIFLVRANAILVNNGTSLGVYRDSGDLQCSPLQPPHSANRHDAGCRGAGADRVGGPEDKLRFVFQQFLRKSRQRVIYAVVLTQQGRADTSYPLRFSHA